MSRKTAKAGLSTEIAITLELSNRRESTINNTVDLISKSLRKGRNLLWLVRQFTTIINITAVLLLLTLLCAFPATPVPYETYGTILRLTHEK